MDDLCYEEGNEIEIDFELDENVKKDIEKSKKKKVPKTILENIECIVDGLEKFKLRDDFFIDAKANIDFLKKKLDLSPIQIVFFSLFIENSHNSYIEISSFTRILGCHLISLLKYTHEIEGLEENHLIRSNVYKGRKSYTVPYEVIDALKQNKKYTYKSLEGLNTIELFTEIENLFEEFDEDTLSQMQLINELDNLIENNPTLNFCKQVKIYEDSFLNNKNFGLFMFFCYRFICLESEKVNLSQIKEIYENKRDFSQIKLSLQSGKNELIKNNIIEYANDNGIANKEVYSLTNKAKEELFVDLELNKFISNSDNGLLEHGKIIEKKLYFNEGEDSQIKKLQDYLSEENFSTIQERLEKQGMRKGFACLFHGSPGTGKTETVYQLARLTKREIMFVDIAQSKSMWYGESEKIIKRIFDKYRGYVKSCKTTPILLFNEADAIIGKRKEANSNSVAQTENTIQNIILQEMENLDGIMIATTNLTQNLDSAFERRFLFKIDFQKPKPEVKAKIWKSMIHSLTKQEALELSNSFDFSGGEIENIVRKYTIDSILTNTKPSIDKIRMYCETEKLENKNSPKNKIGFNYYGKTQDK